MPDPPVVNPYQSPELAADDATPAAATRRRAAWHIRIAILWLAVPAFLNLILFHVAFARVPIFALGNLLGLTLLATVTWVFGLKILEGATVLLHFWFGGDVSQQAWLDKMRESLWLLVWIAPLAAVSWFVWVYLHYIYFDLNSPLWLSPCFVLLGNVLGAVIYGTILWKWYQLGHERADK